MRVYTSHVRIKYISICGWLSNSFTLWQERENVEKLKGKAKSQKFRLKVIDDYRKRGECCLPLRKRGSKGDLKSLSISL